MVTNSIIPNAIELLAPLAAGRLTVFPIRAEQAGSTEYLLAQEVLKTQALLVSEVSEAGSVPNLLVENQSEHRVLFLEGEELEGAKQNRVLNTSVLVPAHAKTRIPVSCVEQGRWSYKSKRFGGSERYLPPSVRHGLKRSLSESARRKRGFASDQHDVWDKVADLRQKHQTESPTGALSDTFIQHEENLRRIRETLRYPGGATGFAVAIDGRVVALDLFDKATTCEQVWDRLLSGAALDALGSGSTEPAMAAEVERALEALRSSGWETVDPVGEGEQLRAAGPELAASALRLNGELVHLSFVLAT